MGERIAQFAADPIVSGLLLTIGFLGLLIEMQTLHAIAGIIGVAALALFFGAHIVAGFSNWTVLAIFGLGILALLFELHVLPGHGISGLVGALLILVSIVLAFGAWYVGVVATALSIDARGRRVLPLAALAARERVSAAARVRGRPIDRRRAI